MLITCGSRHVFLHGYGCSHRFGGSGFRFKLWFGLRSDFFNERFGKHFFYDFLSLFGLGGRHDSARRAKHFFEAWRLADFVGAGVELLEFYFKGVFVSHDLFGRSLVRCRFVLEHDVINIVQIILIE